MMKSLKDYEIQASQILPRESWSFFSGGSEESVTYQDNFKAFKRYRILPRVLRDVSQADTSTTILGHRIPFPVCVSPSSSHARAHSHAEVDTSKGVAGAGTLYTVSSHATVPLEEVVRAAPGSLRFLNLYVFKRRDLVRRLVQTAERLDFKALVVTVDSNSVGPMVGRRLELFLNSVHRTSYAYVNILNEEESKLANYRDKLGHALSQFDSSNTWEDIAWLISITKLPVVLKGILNASDAEKAVNIGASGIIVSNHGGRQLDTAPASIDVLSEVVEAVRGRCEVYIDGGVRTGTDVLKALALGARAVFIGRPIVYGLACKGAAGVQEVLEILRDEFNVAMCCSGCSKISEINSSLLRHKSQLPSARL